QEMRANRLSDEALRKALGENSQEYRERDLRRREVLPGGIGTYVGALAGAPGALAGLVGGKVYGLYDAAQQRAEYERQNKKKKKRQPRDGDGDGRVYDGTPREREAPRESPQPLRKRGADSRGGALH